MQNQIPLFKIAHSKADVKAVTAVIERGSQWTEGPEIEQFETKIAKYVGAKYAVSFSSGTAALHSAISCLSRGPKTVIVPAFTFISTANSAVLAGKNVIFADIEPETMGLDYESVKEKIDCSVGIIILVHYAGFPARDTLKIRELCHRRNILLIEDAAESFGASIGLKCVGTFGYAGMYSFCQNKNISCFPKNTSVLIPVKGRGGKSTEKIQNIKVNDEVITYNHQTSLKETKKVLQIFEREYNGELYIIKLSNNNIITSTPEHEIYVITKGYTKAQDLQIGDEVVQYIYKGLAVLIRHMGKTYEEVYGLETAEKRKKKHSEFLKMAHKDPAKKYLFKDYKAIGKKISFSTMGRIITSEQKQRMSKGQKQRCDNMSIEQRENISRLLKIRWSETSPEQMKKIKHDAKIRWLGMSPEQKSLWFKKYRLAIDKPTYREKRSHIMKRVMGTEQYWVNYFKNFKAKKTELEQKLEQILVQQFPGQWIYNGDYSQKCRVGTLIPDFINTNGGKKAIEVFGRHWHEHWEELEWKERYEREGWEVLIIWEEEFKNELDLIEKVKNYIYNPNTIIVKITGISTKKFKDRVYNIETANNNNYFARGILVHNCGGEGGAIVTEHKSFAHILKQFRSHGRLISNYFESTSKQVYTLCGLNYRLPGICAALGCSQMDNVTEYIVKRRSAAAIYNRSLTHVGITTIDTPSDNYAVYQLYPILLSNTETRDNLQSFLKRQGIASKVYFYPINEERPYSDYEQDLPTTKDISSRILCLPIYPSITFDEQRIIISTIKRFFLHVRK